MNTDGDAPVVFVTGSAKRIGAEIISVFHQQGYRVIIHCNRSLQQARELQATLNSQRPASAHLLQADLNDSAAVQRLASQALSCFGTLDVLINNASSFYATPLHSASEQQWDALFNSNVRAAYFLSQFFAETLRARRGCIINIADINVDRGMAQYSLYSMAKGALQTMTRSLARELAPEVRVNNVSPGAILWPEQQADPQQHATEHARILSEIPLGHLGSPADIACAALFLVQGGSYITGQSLRVDGGRSLS